MSKFLFIHSKNEPQEDIKTLDALGSVLLFRDTYLNQSFSDIFAKYDVIVLDVDNVQYRQWYSAYRNGITSSPNINCVFIHPPHTHIDDTLLTVLKDDWKIKSIIKELPKIWSNKDDLINKLINNIHLASLNLPNTESCFKSLVYAIAEKIGCNSD